MQMQLFYLQTDFASYINMTFIADRMDNTTSNVTHMESIIVKTVKKHRGGSMTATILP